MTSATTPVTTSAPDGSEGGIMLGGGIIGGGWPMGAAATGADGVLDVGADMRPVKNPRTKTATTMAGMMGNFMAGVDTTTRRGGRPVQHEP